MGTTDGSAITNVVSYRCGMKWIDHKRGLTSFAGKEYRRHGFL